MEGPADIIRAITDEMQKSLSAKTIVGDPFTIEGKTIIPLVSIGMGFGAASDVGKSQEGLAKGGGGGGLGIKPVAVIVIDQQGVKVERLKESKHSLAEHLGDAMHKFVEAITKRKETHVSIDDAGEK